MRTSSASVSSEPPTSGSERLARRLSAAPLRIGPTVSSTPSGRSAMLSCTWPSAKPRGAAGGDRVGEQHRVGDPVDGDLVAGGERGQRAAQHRPEELRRADPQLGRLGHRRAAAVRVRSSSADRPASCSGRCMRISVPALDPAADLEARGERRDQRQADPQAGPVDAGARADPRPKSRTATVRPSCVGHRLDLERAGLALRVGVDDDVHAGLGDDRLQVGDRRLVHADPLGQAGDRVAHHRDVLRPRGKRHLQP